MEIFAETERLILRKLLPEDEDGMFELDSDAEVHRYLGKQPVKNKEQVQEVIRIIRQQYVDNGIGRWAVIEKASGNFIGWSGLKLMKETINGHVNYLDLGYRFIKKYWGKGFATETAIVALHYGFDIMKQENIYAITDVNNNESRKVLQKCGLKIEGEIIYDKEPHYWFRISKQDWLKHNIINPSELNAKYKEGIYKLWNNEYPSQLKFGSPGDLDTYLNNLKNPTHYFIENAKKEVIAWAFVFERENERWFAVIIDGRYQGKGYGKALLEVLKEKENVLNGWVIDRSDTIKANEEKYLSPLNFYLKNNFTVSHDVRLETEKLSAVKIKWPK